MARAIDAEELQELCNRRIRDTWNSRSAPVSWAAAYADFKDDIDSIPTITPPNEPLRCTGCMYLDADSAPCVHCVRATRYADYYRRPPEGEKQ